MEYNAKPTLQNWCSSTFDDVLRSMEKMKPYMLILNLPNEQRRDTYVNIFSDVIII